jgi:hypothetical protein
MGSGRSRSLYLLIRRVIKQTVVITETYHFSQISANFYPIFCCHCYLHMQRKLLGIINADFDAKAHLLIIHSAFVKYKACPSENGTDKFMQRFI